MQLTDPIVLFAPYFLFLTWITTISLGYANYVVTRTALYELLLGHIPTHNVSFGMNVVRTEEHNDRVHIYCADNTRYEADLLVGSDGAFSTIRASLYNHLDEKGLLPKVDSENVDAGHVNVMGVTVAKDPVKYPQLKDKTPHMTSTLDPRGERAVSWGQKLGKGGTKCGFEACTTHSTDTQTCTLSTLLSPLNANPSLLQNSNIVVHCHSSGESDLLAVDGSTLRSGFECTAISQPRMGTRVGRSRGQGL